MKKMKFPFSDAPNTACFTCCHVLDENKPILYVSHDEDGYWQFLSELDYGEYAKAESVTSDWIVRHMDK